MICFLLSPFNAKIKVNDNFFNVKQNELFPLPTATSEITVFAEHTNHAFFVPYVINEKNSKTYTYEPLNTKVVEIKPNLFLKQNQMLKLTSPFSSNVTFLNKGKSFVKIINGDKTHINELPALCHSPQIFENENYIVVYAKNYESGFSVSVFNKNNQTFALTESVNKILVEANELNILYSPTPIGTAKSVTYNLSSTTLNSINTFFVDVNSNEPSQTKKGLTLFYAVKSGFFSLTEKLLSQNMKQIATNEMLTAYFKDFNKIIVSPFSNNNEDYLIFNENTISNINFTLNSDLLIDNISKT